MEALFFRDCEDAREARDARKPAAICGKTYVVEPVYWPLVSSHPRPDNIIALQ
jgi:hypothetical protein